MNRVPSLAEAVSNRPSRRWRQLALLLLITLVSASCYVAIKAAAPFTPPLRFAALRLLLGGGALLALLPLFKAPLLPPRQSWRWLGALALTASSFAYGAMFVSPRLAGAGIASVLGNTQPLIIMALAVPLLGERMTRTKWLALVFGITGVLLIAMPALSSPDAYAFGGAALALASAAGLAIGSIIVKVLAAKQSVLTLAAWQLMLGSLPLFARSTLFEATAVTRWTPTFWGLLLFLGLLGTAFVTAAWYSLLKENEAGPLSLFFFLVPVFGLALAALVYGERISLIQGVGVALSIAAILSISFAKKGSINVTPPAKLTSRT